MEGSGTGGEFVWVPVDQVEAGASVVEEEARTRGGDPRTDPHVVGLDQRYGHSAAVDGAEVGGAARCRPRRRPRSCLPAVDLSVPLVADAGTGANWAEAH